MIQIISLNVVVLGIVMLVPAAADFSAGNADWQVFASAALLCIFMGGIVFVSRRGRAFEPSRRDIFILVPLLWFISCCVAAVPFYLSALPVTLAESFFEAASGLTTTGATVITGLDDQPPGILLWRSITQWIGGLGVVAMGMVLLPVMRSGGQQIFLLESSDKSEKPFITARLFATRIAQVYVVLSVLCAGAYFMLGMDLFDAVNHAMTTVSTGGFSTSDASFAKFGSEGMLLVSSLFMLVCGLPFLFLIRLGEGTLLRDAQIPYYLAIVAVASLAVYFFSVADGEAAGLSQLISALFHVTSIVTTTGFAANDYLQWGPAVIALMFFLTFLGGCSGSTAGGYKAFRLVIIREFLIEGLTRVFRPNQVVTMKYGEQRLDPTVATSVMIFSFLYTATFIAFALIYGFLGMDFETAISASATALANVGPGIGGTIGPVGNFSSLSDAAKWLLGIQMVIGRLEVVSLFVLILPRFWR